MYPFATISWVNKDENIAQHIFSAYRTIFLTVTEKNIAWNYLYADLEHVNGRRNTLLP